MVCSGVCSVFIQEELGRLGLPGDVDVRALVVCRGHSSGRQQPRATRWGGQSEPLSGLQGMSTLLFFSELNQFLALSF